MSAKINSLLAETEGLAMRVGAAAARLDAIRSDTASLRPTFDFKLLLDCDALCRTLRGDLDQARAQLEAGTSFLMGFSLWMANRNVVRLERLTDRVAKDAAC